MTSGRDTFCRRLRDARERAGLTLEAVAATTKIKCSLLAALEHGDVSHWPSGIFRRAYVREYAKAIGLPPEETVAEFLRRFPDKGLAVDTYPEDLQSDLRLTLDAEPGRRVPLVARRVAAALLDVGLVVLAGWAIAQASSASLWTASGLVGLMYYPVTGVCVGRPLFGRWLCDDRPSRPASSTRDDLARTRRRFHIVSRRAERHAPIPPARAGLESAAGQRAASSQF